jgi:predicted ATP-grasp superfamily ATP-dependent carboligase
LDPQLIVEIDEQAAASLGLPGTYGSTDVVPAGAKTGPAMLVLLHGFVDAGSTAKVAARHITETMETTRIATFDIDQVLDYRSSRPMMDFDTDRWTGYKERFLAIDHVRDGEGHSFLMLHGTEPDLQWERIIKAIKGIVERFNVSLAVSFHGMPMGVPHTRPMTLTAHGTRSGLTEDYTSFFGSIKLAGSFAMFLEYRLGEAGHDAMGFAVHVPYYLAQAKYPPAAVLALQHTERATGLDLMTERLLVDSSEKTAEVEEEIRESEEAQRIISVLEQQFDEFATQVGTPGRIIDADGPIPTAEELAAEFERFLSSQDKNGGSSDD